VSLRQQSIDSLDQLEREKPAMSALEQSFAALIAAHGMSSVSVGLMMVGERKVFTATVHGGPGFCALGSAPTVAEALSEALAKLNDQRALTKLADVPLDVAA